MLIDVGAEFTRHPQQESPDLDVLFSLRHHIEGEFASKDIATCEMWLPGGETLARLEPAVMPSDRDSTEYECALFDVVDRACRLCDETEPAILDALNKALANPIFVDGIDVRDHV